jgi:hypothetical protein
MGIHFVDGNLVGDGELDAERPEALVYEAKNGQLRLVAVEYIVPVALWHQNHEAPPVLMGQQFLYVGAPQHCGSPSHLTTILTFSRICRVAPVPSAPAASTDTAIMYVPGRSVTMPTTL